MLLLGNHAQTRQAEHILTRAKSVTTLVLEVFSVEHLDQLDQILLCLLMAFYMAFPVGMFWWFNQPQFFEDYVMEHRVTFYVLFFYPEKFFFTVIYYDLKRSL